MARTKRNKRKQPGEDDTTQKKTLEKLETVEVVTQVETLEERVRVNEIIVKDLLERRASFAEQIETTRLKHQRLLERTVLLKERSLHLRAARIKHLTLQRELQESLVKSRERLARLSRLEQLDQQLDQGDDTASCEISTFSEEAQASEQREDAQELADSRGIFDKDSKPLDSSIQVSDLSKVSDQKLSFLSTAALQQSCIYIHQTFNTRQDTEFKSLITFLPAIDHRVVGRILSLSIREANALDNSNDHSARRELLWNTCLDFALLNPTTVEAHSQTFTEQEPGNTSTTSVDPNISLCPYELAGVCADDYCSYQHITKKNLSREQIPLPSLSILGDIDNKLEWTSNTVALEKVPSKSSEEFVERSTTLNENMMSVDCRYIALPRSEPMDAGDDNASDSDDQDEFDRLFTKTSDMIHSYPFVGFEQKIQYGDCSVEQILQIWYETAKSDTRMNSVGSYAFVVNAIRLSIHSGRFDIAHSLIEKEAELGWRKDLLREIWHSCCHYQSKKTSFIRTLFENQAILLVLSACQDMLLGNSAIAMPGFFLNLWSSDDDDDSQIEFTISGFRNVLAGFVGDRKISTVSDDITSKLAKLQRGIHWVKKVFDKPCQSNDSLCRIDSHILKPCWWAIKRWVEILKPEEALWGGIKATILMGFIVLGCLESFASCIKCDSLNTSLTASLIAIDGTVKGILKGLSKHFSYVPMVDLLISPLFAAHVATLTFLRRYSLAHQRLETLLIPSAKHQSGGSVLTPFSELLWSQFIHLRMTLPLSVKSTTSEDDNATRSKRYPWEPSLGSEKENQIIVDKLKKLGLRLHHVALQGDHVLADALSNIIVDAQAKHLHSVAYDVMQWAMMSDNGDDKSKQPLHSLELVGVPLDLRMNGSHERLSSKIPAIPRSILLAGYSMQKLILSQCRLTVLPASFGLYFPNLLILDLSDNEIETVPLSFRSMLSLERLSLAWNRISALSGEELMASLKFLDVSHNCLTQLDDFTECLGRRCFQLEELNLTHNELRITEFLDQVVLPKWSLQMKSLRKVTWTPQKETIIFHEYV